MSQLSWHRLASISRKSFQTLYLGGDVNLYGYVWNNPYNFIDPFGYQGWGETFADWLDSKIEKARLGAQRDARNWIWNGVVNTLADLASAAPDALRLGKGIGCALFNDQASGYDRAWAVARDVGRGLTLTGVGVGVRAAAKGIGKAISKARAPRSATQIAREGGRHAGQLKQFEKQTPRQLQKTIRSFDKQISKHKAWIKNPTLKVKNFSSLSKKHQKNIIHHWQQDIIRHRELKSIARDVLKGQ